MTEPVVHDLAWGFVRAYRAWFLTAPRYSDQARVELRAALVAWVEAGMPLVQGEADGTVPPYVRERLGLPGVRKSE